VFPKLARADAVGSRLAFLSIDQPLTAQPAAASALLISHRVVLACARVVGRGSDQTGAGVVGALPLMPTPAGVGWARLMNPWRSSSGKGNTIVEFFSAAISVKVCR
jgi:hypothetical protein